jgi:hypothetical protein
MLLGMENAKRLCHLDLQSRMIATAIRIMRTWWYPMNGINPRTACQFPFHVQEKSTPTLYANGELEVGHGGCVSLGCAWNADRDPAPQKGRVKDAKECNQTTAQ